MKNKKSDSTNLKWTFPISVLIATCVCIIHNESHAASAEINQEKCQLYLAESSIPGSGQGIFTTLDVKKGERVGESDIVIPTVDLAFHNGGSNPPWPHLDYYWKAIWAVDVLIALHPKMNATPLGALCNYHTYLHNIVASSHDFDDSLSDRSVDPGAGGYSYYAWPHKATRDISAGEEVFLNYGERWLDTRKDIDFPRKAHFKNATKIVRELMSDNGGRLPDDATLRSLKKIVSWYDERTSSMLPETAEELERDFDSGVVWKGLTNRTVEWLRENGKCFDNIYRDVSGVPQAGYGAFSKRLIEKGSLVVPVPLLHITNSSEMNMYGATLNGRGDRVPNMKKTFGKQLMMNYCFGNEKSTMLLCMNSHGALINHKVKCRHGCIDGVSDGPNAEIYWSEDDTTKLWLGMDVEDIGKQHGRGLTLDIIATRDIYPGEEIFINYGPQWDSAWNKHISTWTAPVGKLASSSSSITMNDDRHAIRTEQELETDPYPFNIMTGCLYWDRSSNRDEENIDHDYYPDNHDDEHTTSNNQYEYLFESLTVAEEIRRSSISGEGFVFQKEEDARDFWPCNVHERSPDKKNYTVQIYQSPDARETKWHKEGKRRFVRNLPRDSIRFFNRPYRSDMFLPKAFRHSIGLRDEIFPNNWENVRNERDEL